MSIISSEVIDQSLQASGNYRVRFKYTFQDGREYIIGPISASSQEQINQLLIDKEDPLVSSVKQSDAQEAQSKSIKVAYMTASQSDVYYAYLFAGYNVDEPLESYLLMEPVAQEILDLGMTVEQMAALFGEELSVAQGVFDRWAYLESNEAEILAYKIVKDGI